MGKKFDAYQVVLDIDVYNDKDIKEKNQFRRDEQYCF